MSARHTKFYLDKRNGKIMGVCSGIADYTGIDVTLVRVAMVLGAIFSNGIILLAYFIIGWVADDKPREFAGMDRVDEKFWQGVRAKPTNSVRDVRSKFRDIDRRLAEVEMYYTSRNRRLADEIDALR